MILHLHHVLHHSHSLIHSLSSLPCCLGQIPAHALPCWFPLSHTKNLPTSTSTVYKWTTAASPNEGETAQAKRDRSSSFFSGPWHPGALRRALPAGQPARRAGPPLASLHGPPSATAPDQALAPSLSQPATQFIPSWRCNLPSLLWLFIVSQGDLVNVSKFL